MQGFSRNPLSFFLQTFRPLLSKLHFSDVPHTPKVAIQSVFKRPLPGNLIQLNSSYGKQIFSEALQEGNMECFFPLIEQFATQYKPSTCGTTTLAMVLNSLGIDPKVTWKGIWRWYSEESLACSHPDYLNEIDIEKFTHLAKRNYSSIQMFYHNSIKTLHSFDKSIMECPTGFHSSTSITKKVGNYDTFFDCCVASSRRDGFFLVTNSSRKALQQTGIGHFSPIGGVHLKKKLVLILDVARYKYPPYWCDIKKLFDSLEEIDTATQKPRGFCLITKNYARYARICRETEDFLSIKNVIKKLKGFKYENQGKKSWELVKDVFMKMLKHFSDDFRFLLVHYLFELGNRIDPDQIPHHENKVDHNYDNGFGEKYLKLFKEQFEQFGIKEFCKGILSEIDGDKDTQKIGSLIRDFHPYLIEEIVGIMLFSMPWEFNEVKIIFKDEEKLRKNMKEYEEKKDGMKVIKNEVNNLKLNLGLECFIE